MAGAEEWRPVFGWDGFYEVSDLGRIRSLPRSQTIYDRRYGNYIRETAGRILSPYLVKGYPAVVLSGGGRRRNQYVHLAVAAAFLGPCPVGMEACHRDGDEANPALANLRWGTRKSNMADKKAHGTEPVGERRWSAKLRPEDVLEIRRSQGRTHKDLAAAYGLHPGYISVIRAGRTWKHLS